MHGGGKGAAKAATLQWHESSASNVLVKLGGLHFFWFFLVVLLNPQTSWEISLGIMKFCRLQLLNFYILPFLWRCSGKPLYVVKMLEFVLFVAFLAWDHSGLSSSKFCIFQHVRTKVMMHQLVSCFGVLGFGF